MDWYYSSDGQQKGPVGEAELQRLVEQGTVTPATLVWREGMAGWEPHGGSVVPPLPGTLPTDAVACASCGQRVPEADSFLLSGARYCAACKPHILQRIMEGKAVVSPAAEEMRKSHLSHEASVKSIGFLYFLGGAAITFAAIAMMIGAVAGRNQAGAPIVIGVGLLLLALAAGQIIVGYGLRRLQPWARIPTGILSGIGVLGFPLGTIINGYILYLVFSKKGSTVFSPEYQDVIRQTPHIKYKTSIVVWIVLGLVLLLIIAGISAAVLSQH